MVFFWGIWTALSLVLVWLDRKRRGVLFWVPLLLAPILLALFILTGLDNAKSEVVDCREVVNPTTGEDELSCAKDHWLPDGVWRVINRY
jgi:hypothetical protein